MRRIIGWGLGAPVLAAALLLPACSGDNDAGPDASGAGLRPANTESGPPGAQPGGPVATTAAPLPSAPPPETGVPGLDSDNVFCAAWSRYAGSYQVIAVASFALDPPFRAFELEVLGAGVVAGAYADMETAWPAELEPERQAALVDTFGPFAARATTALSVLTEAGAAADARAEIDAAWLAALAARNPEVPDLAVAIDAPIAELVTAAAADLASTLAPIGADPTLIIEVATPLTDAYLAARCPDEGVLAGSDVVE